MFCMHPLKSLNVRVYFSTALLASTYPIYFDLLNRAPLLMTWEPFLLAHKRKLLSPQRYFDMTRQFPDLIGLKAFIYPSIFLYVLGWMDKICLQFQSFTG